MSPWDRRCLGRSAPLRHEHGGHGGAGEVRTRRVIPTCVPYDTRLAVVCFEVVTVVSQVSSSGRRSDTRGLDGRSPWLGLEARQPGVKRNRHAQRVIARSRQLPPRPDRRTQVGAKSPYGRFAGLILRGLSVGLGSNMN